VCNWGRLGLPNNIVWTFMKIVFLLAENLKLNAFKNNYVLIIEKNLYQFPVRISICTSHSDPFIYAYTFRQVSISNINYAAYASPPLWLAIAPLHAVCLCSCYFSNTWKGTRVQPRTKGPNPLDPPRTVWASHVNKSAYINEFTKSYQTNLFCILVMSLVRQDYI
jgi:hypothetical protein